LKRTGLHTASNRWIITIMKDSLKFSHKTSFTQSAYLEKKEFSLTLTILCGAKRGVSHTEISQQEKEKEGIENVAKCSIWGVQARWVQAAARDRYDDDDEFNSGRMSLSGQVTKTNCFDSLKILLYIATCVFLI